MNVAQPLVQVSLVGEAIDHGPVAVFVADEEMRYVAVNQFACELLGYDREELLSLRVPDVARYPEAPAEFGELIAGRSKSGTTELTRKDGGVFRLQYQASETKVAGMQVYVAIGWPEVEVEATAPRRRRRPSVRATV